MLQQLRDILFSPSKKSISNVLSDIKLIYKYIQQNGEIYDDWHFHHLFTTSYWNYLKYYPDLSDTEQDYLILGCLNIILFLAHKYIENKSNYLQKHFREINKAVDDFLPATNAHKQLWYMVKEALILTGKKMNGLEYKEKRNNLYHSIGWSLKNTIIDSNSSLIRLEKIESHTIK